MFSQTKSTDTSSGSTLAWCLGGAVAITAAGLLYSYATRRSSTAGSNSHVDRGPGGEDTADTADSVLSTEPLAATEKTSPSSAGTEKKDTADGPASESVTTEQAVRSGGTITLIFRKPKGDEEERLILYNIHSDRHRDGVLPELELRALYRNALEIRDSILAYDPAADPAKTAVAIVKRLRALSDMEHRGSDSAKGLRELEGFTLQGCLGGGSPGAEKAWSCLERDRKSKWPREAGLSSSAEPSESNI